MQHIVNVAFDFDDKKIADSIEDQVHTEVVNNITEEVKKVIFEKKWGHKRCYDDSDPAPLKRIVEDRVSEILEENKDIIIDGAIKLLAEKLSRTKLVKEAVGKLVGINT